MNYIRLSLLAFGFFSVSSMCAQQTTTKETIAETIDDKFTEVINKGGKYRNNGKVYRVIETYQLSQLQKSTKTRIDGLQAEITDLKKQIKDQQAAASKVSAALSETQETLKVTQDQKDAINFLGQPMSKSGYKGMMWAIVAVLLLLLIFFIYRFRNSNVLTKGAQLKLEEIELEFDEYRRKALEKEQKLGRQLQDERNKLLKSIKG